MNYLRWIAGVAFVSACGASTPATTSAPSNTSFEAQAQITGPVHKRGEKKLIATVGAAGGTLELDNGARLVIPEGALDQPVELTFAEGARTTAFSNHDYERPVGPTLEVAPELTLSSPFEVSIPVGELPEGFEASDLALGVEVPATRQRAIEGQSTQTRWDYREAASKSGRAAAPLAELPGYRVQFVVSKSD
jgi:hypothetical protein